MAKYKVGDRVTVIGTIKATSMDMIVVGSKCIITNVYRSSYRIRVHGSPDAKPWSNWSLSHHLELDKQYYRNIRLNKILGDDKEV
jgi:hypothetical protein